MNDEQIGDDEADVAGPSAAPLALVERIEDFCTTLNSVTTLLSNPERAAAAGDIGVLEVALRRFADACRLSDYSPPASLIAQVGWSLDRLQIPLSHCVIAAGRAERRRHVEALSVHARECFPLAQSIGHALEPALDGTDYCLSIAAEANKAYLVSASAQIDAKINKLDRVVGTHRLGSEERAERFEAEMQSYSLKLEDLIERQDDALNDSIAAANERVDNLAAEVQELQGRATDLLGEVVVAGIASGYEKAGDRERRAANRWRLAALLASCLCLVPLTVALIAHADLQTLDGFVIHLSISAACGAIATYCGRQAAEHRREERSLRSDQLRLVASMAWMADLPVGAREDLKKKLADTYFGTRPAEPRPVPDESTIVFPYEQILRGASEMIGGGAKAGETGAGRDRARPAR